jgi:peptidoglycan hydrolase-like protein with peptidoglycan-binding domain
MTIKQRQCLLAYLGYYTGAVDGICGNQTQEATRRFQQDFGLTPDGIFGVGTEERIRQAIGNYDDLVLDVPSNATISKMETTTEESSVTGTFWDEIEFFTREEFRCQCKGKYCDGFPVEPDEKMVRTIDEIRRRLGVPVSIVDAGGSGIRCAQHNANVGGVYNSEHLYGRAADLHSSVSPARMKQVAEEVMGNTGGIGLYRWGIHVDTGKYSRWNG